MAQISKYPIHKKVEERIFDVFKSTIAHLDNSQDIEEFLEEFLSPVEKIMLAKRLSIAILLGKGYTYPTIAKILRVTPSTIASVSSSLKYKGKGYRKIVEKILKDEKTDAFWEKIEDFLANIPKTKGSSWVYQKQQYEKQKREQRKAF